MIETLIMTGFLFIILKAFRRWAIRKDGRRSCAGSCRSLKKKGFPDGQEVAK